MNDMLGGILTYKLKACRRLGDALRAKIVEDEATLRSCSGINATVAS